MAEVFKALAVPWFAVVGNHDLLGNGGDIFDELFGPRNSDFTCARTRFVLLDTNSREYGFGGGVPDLAWLERRLDPSPDHDRVVVISHVAPWSSDFDPGLRDAFVSQLGSAGVALSIHTAFLTGLTLSYEVHPYVALVSSFAWAASQGPEGHALDDDLDLFQYDLGVQGQYPLAVGNGLTLKPFVGAGLGARKYDYRDLDIDSETDLAGYFSLGASLEYRNTMAGLTVRDYVSDYDGIGVEEGSSTRNDLSVFVSVGARF